MNHTKRIFICLLALAIFLGGVSLPSAQTTADSGERIYYFTAYTAPPVIITIDGSGIARTSWPEFRAIPGIAESFFGNEWLADSPLSLCMRNQADDTLISCALPAPLPPLTNKKVETMRN